MAACEHVSRPSVVREFPVHAAIIVTWTPTNRIAPSLKCTESIAQHIPGLFNPISTPDRSFRQTRSGLGTGCHSVTVL